MMNRSHLVEETLNLNLGKKTPGGALVVETGKHTGRCTKQRYIAAYPEIENEIHWGAVNQKATPEFAESVFAKLQRKLSTRKTYDYDGYVGFFPVHVHSLSPWHIIFADNMFRKNPVSALLNIPKAQVPEISIFHDPYGHASELELENYNEETLILLDPAQMRVAIIGSAYAGEIKKSAFTLCNYKLPTLGVLPMHSSANCMTDGSDSSVIFGLSGTGKTTLSADPNRPLIGDDEIIWTETGLSNLEGGCYAKLIKLDESKEPEIFKAVHKDTAIMENVAYSQRDGLIDFYSAKKTENTRGSYPITALDQVFDQTQEASHPNTIIFLTADAFGALPAVAQLDEWQAQYHFIMGYTAKVAGTEIGITEPTAAFSSCFGGPFMPRPASVYAKMLAEKAKEHGASVWILNTGWFGGGYGIGERFPIPVTRHLLTAIQTGVLDQQKMVKHPIFGFNMPATCPGVDSEWLVAPEGKAVEDLAKKFIAQSEKIKDVLGDQLIAKGGPKL